MYGQIKLQSKQVLKYQLSEVLERALIGCAIDILIWCLLQAATLQRFMCGVRLPNSSTLLLDTQVSVVGPGWHVLKYKALI